MEQPSPTAASRDATREGRSTASDEQGDTEVQGVAADGPTTPARTAPDPEAKGPVVRLFNAFTDDGTVGAQMRQVLLAALGIGFLTAAGFIGATWHSRRGVRRGDLDGGPEA